MGEIKKRYRIVNTDTGRVASMEYDEDEWGVRDELRRLNRDAAALGFGTPFVSQMQVYRPEEILVDWA